MLVTISLVLLASIIHALWNLVARTSKGNLTLFAYGLSLSGLSLLLIIIYFSLPTFTDLAWLCVLGSTISHSLYFIYLSKAYKAGEISVVYPITRGISVSFAVTTGVVILGEEISPELIAGVFLILCGIFLISECSLSTINKNKFTTLYSLLAGVGSGIYSTFDKFGATGSSSLPLYICLVWIGTGIILFLKMRLDTTNSFSDQKIDFKNILIIGFGTLSGYLIILYAFQSGPLSFISPAREVSVIFGSLLGSFALKEKISGLKWIGIILIFFGLVVLSMS